MSLRKDKFDKSYQSEKLRKLLEDSIEKMNCIGCTPEQMKCRNCILKHHAEYLYQHGARIKNINQKGENP